MPRWSPSAAGREEFNTALEELVLGGAHAARRDRRARTLQCPGGCGALRVGAELIKAASPRDGATIVSVVPLRSACRRWHVGHPHFVPARYSQSSELVTRSARKAGAPRVASETPELDENQARGLPAKGGRQEL